MHGFSFELCFLASLSLCFALGSCGDSAESSTTGSSSSETGTSSTTSTTTSTTTEATSTTTPTTTDGTSMTTATSTADASTSAATDAGTQGSTGESSTTDATDSGSTGGEGLALCSAEDMTCPQGTTCYLDECRDCMGGGVCIPAGSEMCGGFPGFECPEGKTCLNQGGCIADAFGACVPDEMVDPICDAQPSCFGCS